MTRVKPFPILGLKRRKAIPRNKAVISIESVRQIGPYGGVIPLPLNDEEYK